MASSHLDYIVAAKPLVATGGILRGTAASPLPTNVTAALDATFLPLGYVDDKGVTVATNVSTTDKKAWGGYIVRTLTTDTAVDVTFSLLEFMNGDAIKAAYGEDNVVVTPSASGTGNSVAVRFSGNLPPAVPYVIEARDGNRRIRTVLPRVQIVDQGGFTFDDNQTLNLDLKGKAYPDDNGVSVYTYIDTVTTTTP